MNPAARLGAYGLVLAAALGGGAAVGSLAGPIDVGAGATHGEGHDPAPERSLPAGGLLVAQDGYRLEPESRVLGGGPFRFAVTGPEGHPLREYALLHDRRLHLIIASSDLRSYAHLHPEQGADGTWSVEAPTLPAGAYRAFADFQPEGAEQYTLGVDVTVPGALPVPEPLRPLSRATVDGLDVDLDLAGDGTATVTVRRGSAVITTEPYLGAAGHLVALRDGDLAYLHVHPLDDEPAGPVRFAVEVPSAGIYALFFDFQVGGVVRTARFVVDAPEVAHDDGGHA